jgi:hypothetical protein
LRSRPIRGRALVALSLILLSATGCASRVERLEPVLDRLDRHDYAAAVLAHETLEKEPKELLGLLERGYLLHLAGRFEASNEAFEAAERKAEELRTVSVTNEALAFLTTDKLRPYRGSPFEMQFVHYYRALNYAALGLTDDALVEARKSSAALASWADEGQKGGPGLSGAFLHWMTGMLYAAAGEWNDAAVSFRLAAGLYRAPGEGDGAPVPAGLRADLYAAARRVGLDDLVDSLAAADPELAAAVEAPPNVVVLLESGHVPALREVALTLPVLESRGGDHWLEARRYVDRYGHDIYGYGGRRATLSHVLRFALPSMVDRPARAASGALFTPEGPASPAEPALDLAAEAHRDFGHRLPGLILKTVARALAKEGARKAGEKKNDTLGVLLNMAGVLTEQADTRSLVLLPGRIEVARLRLPPGVTTLGVRFFDGSGVLVEEYPVPVTVRPGETVFLSVRSFR